jgi:glutathione S-transferase
MRDPLATNTRLMHMPHLTLPSLVLASAVSTFFVGAWLGGRVSGFRKAAKIPYPYEYASYEQIQTASPSASAAMHVFNRAQRGHQNFNENQTSFLGALLITGLEYPRTAAVLGAAFSVGRVLYGWGYTSGPENGKGRYYGAFGMIAQYVALLMSAKVAWDFCV